MRSPPVLFIPRRQKTSEGEKKKEMPKRAKKNVNEREKKKVLTELVGMSGDRQGSEDITYLLMTPKTTTMAKGQEFWR